MDQGPESRGLRAYFRAANRVVRWFLWGAITLVASVIAILGGLVGYSLLLPEGRGFPDPEAETMRGVRTVWMYAETNQSAERCGMDKGEIAAAMKAALGSSAFTVTETPGNTDATLVYRMHGASAASYCVVMVSWYLHGAVLSKKDRRDSYATLAFGTTMVEYPPRDVSAGKSLVADYVSREMRELARRWSRVNPRQ